MRALFLVVVAACSLPPALASEPGQPLDCSDWVFRVPGLSCVTAIPFPCPTGSRLCSTGGVSYVIDNEGFLVALERRPTGISCGVVMMRRLTLVGFRDGFSLELGYIEDRCVDPSISKVDLITGDWPVGDGFMKTAFDEERGRLYAPLWSICEDHVGPPGCDTDDYSMAGSAWLAAIDGFTTTFEILQTYTPTSGPISFRVPYMPEGFPAADYFDTYYGDLATVGDWSQAQPLECGYPATPPDVGDYLQVDDPLPSPAPGQGRYYLTAAHHQRQTRFGRQAVGGVLSGRNPALLPACSFF